MKFLSSFMSPDFTLKGVSRKFIGILVSSIAYSFAHGLVTLTSFDVANIYNRSASPASVEKNSINVGSGNSSYADTKLRMSLDLG